MDGPTDGKYWIQLAAAPKPRIGIDEKYVITEGRDNVFTVRKLQNGLYTLALGQAETPLFINEDDGKLDRGLIPLLWSIKGHHGGPYTIEVPSIVRPTKGWTVNNPGPKSLVTLKIIEVPLPDQQWNFIRWPGPE